MNQVSDSKKLYLDALAEKGAARIPGGSAAWVRDLRERGTADFSRLGFPTTRLEDWKYTNVGAIERHVFKPVPRNLNGATVEHVAAAAFQDIAVHWVVFVNGTYAPELSSVESLPTGVFVGSLSAALDTRPESLEPHLGRHTPSETHGFAALNTAFLGDGACIHLDKGVVVEKPFHLLFVATEECETFMIQPRNLIVADENSQATVIEHYVAVSEARYLTNAVTEVIAGRNAQVEHYRIQQESGKAYHIGGLYVHQERDSRFAAHAVDLGGLLVRNDLRNRLDAEGTECVLNGLYVVDGRQHVDNHTHIDHAKPHTSSREFYKGVLDGRARAVFSGRIVVHQDAQHTDAEQMNNNLLLSEDAEVDTKPQLEIYADDVKCSHGATVGQLDPDAMFYLRSRAVDEAAARDLLTYAFANDVLSRIRLMPIRLRLEQRLTMRLLHGRGIRAPEGL